MGREGEREVWKVNFVGELSGLCIFMAKISLTLSHTIVLHAFSLHRVANVLATNMKSIFNVTRVHSFQPC